jgi:hypothetical protein
MRKMHSACIFRQNRAFDEANLPQAEGDWSRMNATGDATSLRGIRLQ